MTDDKTPMECHSLDQSRDERVQAELIRNRRQMRRAYARSYSSDDAHPLRAPEPVLEQSGFAPLPDTPAEQPPTRYWTGFAHGFCAALGGVLVLTGVLLWKGMP